MAYIKTIKDGNGNVIYPQTHVKAIYNADGSTLESTLNNLPTKVSDFENDTGFITNTVDNLTNYYKKTETFTQDEVKGLINAITTLNIEVVSALPDAAAASATTIYLKSIEGDTNNNHEEWLCVNGVWELIGTTQVDLTPYALKTEIPTQVSQLTNDAGYLTAHQDISHLAAKTELPTKTSELTNDSDFTTNANVEEAFNNLAFKTLEHTDANPIDFNNITEPGVYVIKNIGQTTLNAPELFTDVGNVIGFNVILIVTHKLSQNSAVNVYQELIYNADKTTAHHYIRRADYGYTWSAIQTPAEQIKAGTLTAGILCPTPSSSMSSLQIANKEYVDNNLVNYYLKTEVDGLIPTATSELTNDSDFVNQEYVNTKINTIDITKDWNENDATAAAYIKNRTHYMITETKDIENPIYENSSITPDLWTEGVYRHYSESINQTVDFANTEFLYFTIDEQDYKAPIKAGKYGRYYVGNLHLIDEEEIDTGETYCIYLVRGL